MIEAKRIQNDLIQQLIDFVKVKALVLSQVSYHCVLDCISVYSIAAIPDLSQNLSTFIPSRDHDHTWFKKTMKIEQNKCIRSRLSEPPTIIQSYNDLINSLQYAHIKYFTLSNTSHKKELKIYGESRGLIPYRIFK